MSTRFARSAPCVTVLGVVLLLLGLALDAAIHRRNPTLAGREHLATFANLGHLLLGLSVALIVIGSGLFLLARATQTSRSVLGRAAALLGILVLFALLLVSLGSLAAESRAAPAAAEPEHPAAADSPAASQLLADTRAGAARFADFGLAEAEGYRKAVITGASIPDWWPAHYTSQSSVRDGRFLDPTRPESLIYLKLPGGRMQLLGAMYVALPDQPVDTALPWHTHTDACFGPGGAVGFVGPDGRCPPGQIQPANQPGMLHVWLFDNPDGPFAQQLSARAVAAAYVQFGRS